jgi:DnaJ-class molecular chaperone
MKYHPDKNPDNPEIATEKFKSVSEAYDALTKQPSEAEGISFEGMSFEGMSFDPSMFTSMFNIPKTNVVTVMLKMKDIVEGATVEACMQVQKKCPQCTRQTPSVRTRCKACGGNGCQRVRIMDMEMMTQCTECMGSGTILGTECGHCDGSRKILIDEVYEAHIPPGWNPKNLVKTDHPECMIRVVHELPDHIQIIGKDIVMTEFVTIKDVLAGFSRKIHLYDDRYIKIRCNQAMNPEIPYVSKVKAIPGGVVNITWNVIWDMTPIHQAGEGIRKALNNVKQARPD